jgi:hypothetical protein
MHLLAEPLERARGDVRRLLQPRCVGRSLALELVNLWYSIAGNETG